MERLVIKGQPLYTMPGGLVCYNMMQPGRDVTAEDIQDVAHAFLTQFDAGVRQNFTGDIVESHIALADHQYYNVPEGTWLLTLRIPALIEKSLDLPDMLGFEFNIIMQ